MTENDTGSSGAPTTEAPEQPDTPTGETPGSGQGVNTDALKDIRTWRRTIGEDRKVAGVAGGIARALNIDPTIVRVLFVVLAFANGFGLVLYALGWLLMPEEESDEPLIRASSGVRTALIAGAVLLALLVSLGITAAIISGSNNGFFWPLFPIIGGLLVILWFSQRRDERRSSVTTQQTQNVPVGPPGTTGSTTTTYAAPPPSRRDRGPRLFGVTLALLAIGLGTLGIIDSATAGIVPGSAYPALALAIIGLMLLIGSVFGRANGLIFLGIIASLVLAGTTSTSHWNSGHNAIDATPISASAVASDYTLGAGNIALDLSQVSDIAALQGRTITIELDAGNVTVDVPDNLGVDVVAEVRYGGQINLPDRQADGWGVQLSQQLNPQASTQITLHIVVRFGQIQVRHA